MTKRIFASAFVLVSILFLPYWIYLPLVFIVVIVFPIYWEGILLALLIDVLHKGAFNGIGDIFYSFGFYTLLAIIVFIPLRERLRYHA